MNRKRLSPTDPLEQIGILCTFTKMKALPTNCSKQTSFFRLLLIACCCFVSQAYHFQTDMDVPCPWLDSAENKLAEAQKLIDKELYNSSINLLAEAENTWRRCSGQTGVDDNFPLKVYYWLGYAYFHISDYEKSSFFFYSILKSENTDLYYSAKAYTGIANIANVRHDREEARKALSKVLEINKTLENESIFLSVYNNLANTFSSQEAYDSALFYLEKAYDRSFRTEDSARRISIMLNIANNLQIQKRLEESEYYYKKAITEARKQENRLELCQATYGLALLYLKTGQNENGLNLLDDCLRLASESSYRRMELYIFDRLSRYWKEQGDYKSAYTYLANWQRLNDTVFNIESERNINRLRADFDLYQMETTKQLLEKDLSIYKSKIFRRNVNISILAILVLAMTAIAFFITRKFLNRNKEYSSLLNDFDTFKTQTDEEKKRIFKQLQSELEVKNKELTVQTLLSIKTEEAAGLILENVKKLKSGSKGKNNEILTEIESAAKDLRAKKGLDEFIYCFEQISSSFYDNLNTRYPGLTAGDQRLAALLSLGLTTKEIAIITHRSVRGVETSKFRLKKKMNLESDQNLTEFLSTLQ